LATQAHVRHLTPQTTRALIALTILQRANRSAGGHHKSTTMDLVVPPNRKGMTNPHSDLCFLSFHLLYELLALDRIILLHGMNSIMRPIYYNLSHEVGYTQRVERKE